jgi:hypothetical protein
VAARRAELNNVRASTRTAAVAEAPTNFLTRMWKFLGI